MTSGVSRFEAGDPPFYKIQTMYVPEPCPTVPLSMPKTLKYLAATAPYVEGPISSNEVPPTFITIRPPPLSIPTAIPVGTFSPNWSTSLLVFAQKSARQL